MFILIVIGLEPRLHIYIFLHSPVDFAIKSVAPENPIVGHVQVQSHCVLLRGDHLTVLPLHQVDAADLVAVGEQQVRTLPF